MVSISSPSLALYPRHCDTDLARLTVNGIDLRRTVYVCVAASRQRLAVASTILEMVRAAHLVKIRELTSLSHRGEKVVYCHAPSVVRIDETRLDDAVRTDNECCGNRQDPGLVALEAR
jgi:hypothetical protein